VRASSPSAGLASGVSAGDDNRGAYRLYLVLREPIEVCVGALGRFRLARGDYVYLGSARRHLRQRVQRHRRLAESKQGRAHWHLDALLLHPASCLTRVESICGASECALATEAAARPGSSIPIPGFGASDCRSGCRAHLVRLATDAVQCPRALRPT
jgi:Uri superfamily endonuclease